MSLGKLGFSGNTLWWSLFLGFFLVFRVAGLSPAGADESVVSYEAALRLYESGVYGEAARMLESRLARQPDDFLARKLLARIYLQLQDYDRLQAQAEVLLEMRPDDLEVAEWLDLARRRIEEKIPQRITELLAGLERDPENHQLYLQLAELYARLDQVEQAIAQFDRAYQIQPDNPNMILAYARFMAGLERVEEAGELYRRYLELEPDPAIRQEMLDVLLLPGMRYFDSEDYRRAAEFFQGVVESFPEELPLLLRYARMLSWVEMYNESVIAYRTYLAEKDEPEVRLEMIRVLAWKENFLEAVRELRLMLEQDPDNLDALVLLADIYRWNDDMHRAEQYYERVLELSPGYEQALAGLEELAEMRRLRQEEARMFSIPFMEQRVAEEPDNLELRLQLARLYVAAGRHPEARPLYGFYLERRPERSSIRWEFATVLSNLQEYGPAVRQLELYLRDNPEDVSVRMQIVTMRMWQGQYEQAERDLQQLLEMGSEVVEVHWRLATIYQIASDWENALFHYRKVLELDPDYQVAAARIRAIEKNPFRRLAEKQREVRRRPHEIGPLLELADMFFEMERYAEAVMQWERVLELQPGHREAERMRRRTGHIMERQRAERIRYLRAELREKPRDLQGNLELARLLRDQEVFREAELRYRLYLHSNPEDYQVEREYAEMLSWRPEYRHRGIERLRRLVELHPEDYELRLHLIRVLTWDRDYWREAEDELEELLILDPENLEMQTALADLHRYQGRFEKARRIYEDVQMLEPEAPRTVEGLQQIDEQLRSRLNFELGLMRDNDNFSESRIGLRYSTFNEIGTRYGLGVSSYRFEENGEPFSGSASAVVVTGEIEGRMADHLIGRGWLDVGSYSRSGMTISGGVSGAYALDPVNTLSLTYQSYPAVIEKKTVRSLDQEIDLDKIIFRWDSQPPERVEHLEPIQRVFFEGFLSFGGLSDNNTETAFLIRPFYRFQDQLNGQPSIDFMFGWHGLSYTRQSDFYWSPEAYSGPTLGVRVAGTTWRDFLYQAEFQALLAEGEGGGTRNFNLGFNRPFGDHWLGNINFGVSESSRDDDFRYRAVSVMLGLMYFF